MRLAAYEDTDYRRDASGALSTTQAFPLFMFRLAEDPRIERLSVMGRLSAGSSHFRVPPGADFVPLPFYESLREPVAVLRAVWGTTRTAWRTLAAVDALFVCGPSPMAILIAFLGLVRRKRLVLCVRQNTNEYARQRFAGCRPALMVFRLMEAVWRGFARVARAALVGPELYALYDGAPRRHELAVSFVSEADIAPVREPRDPERERVLLSVGRLDTEKNPLLLADILAALGPGYRLKIVGEGELADELRARLVTLGVGDQADLLGYVSFDGGLFELYRSADAFLHVSWTEGFPQVLLEAFAARLPVVATEVGGVGALASRAAILVPPGDAASAAAAVQQLFEGDGELALRHVEVGVQRVRERTLEAERSRLVDFMTR